VKVKRQRLLKLLERKEPIWRLKDHPELKDGAAAWVARMRMDDLAQERKRQGR